MRHRVFKRGRRILAAGIAWTLLACCTAGCSSIITTSETLGRGEIASSVAAQESLQEETKDGVRLNYTDEERNQEVPNYFRQNMEEKFKELGGKQAFRIKDGHSDDSADIEDFQIVDLLNGNTFLYGYTTNLEGSGTRMVHCAALYNYQTQSLKVVHENAFTRSGAVKEDKESFFVQTSGNEIFVYDNGTAYLYSTGGTLKSKSDIEGFLRAQYPNAHSITVSNALTDGSSRVYLEVSVEHQELKLPTADVDDGKTEEELDEEAEDLDEEVDEKVSDFILQYEVNTISSAMYQENTNFDAQKNAWINMTKDKEYTSMPNAESDWTSTVKSKPDQWGGAYLLLGPNNKVKADVYQWINKPNFLLDNGIISFLASPNSYKHYTALKSGADMRTEGLFAPLSGSFSLLNGKLSQWLEAKDEVTIKRTVKVVTQQEVKDAEGKVTQAKVTENREQTIKKKKTRYRRLEGCYTETYRILDPDKVDLLGNCVGGLVLCSGDDTFYWAESNGDLHEICSVDEEGYMAGILKHGSSLYLVASGNEKMHVSKLDESWETDLDDGDTMMFLNLGGGYVPGNSVYDQAFQRTMSGGGSDLYGGAEVYNEKNVLLADLHVDPSLARNLQAMGVSVLGMPQGGTCSGYLLTSMSRGLIFQNPDHLEGTVLADGCWYRSFEKGNQIVSVGFANGDNSYSSMDMAFARVYEYNLSDLCETAMRGTLTELRDAEAKKSAVSSGADQETEPGEPETVKSMEDHWNEEYDQKYTKVEPETAMSAGEEFDIDAFNAEQSAAEQVDEESSRAARIEEILNGP